jgi:hypothetical protein
LANLVGIGGKRLDRIVQLVALLDVARESLWITLTNRGKTKESVLLDLNTVVYNRGLFAPL